MASGATKSPLQFYQRSTPTAGLGRTPEPPRPATFGPWSEPFAYPPSRLSQESPSLLPLVPFILEHDVSDISSVALGTNPGSSVASYKSALYALLALHHPPPQCPVASASTSSRGLCPYRVVCGPPYSSLGLHSKCLQVMSSAATVYTVPSVPSNPMLPCTIAQRVGVPIPQVCLTPRSKRTSLTTLVYSQYRPSPHS